MIVRSLVEISGSERDVNWGLGQSRRFLLADDNMGFTVADTTIPAETAIFLEYKHHLEACYCIEGTGEVEDMNGNIYPIEPGVIYALDKHDPHFLRVFTDMRLVSVFSPALNGAESHSLSNERASTY
ncbi:L-ectoine synthase [Phyllobacterium phragmitis]|uniref:L-ectoine synthase n=1 Tax=Phyllobacterium phragmitis TaxID=2670329 RepID=A0A2S9ISL8_9HYPH|nr:ectoine synthase [Phyllobacterium phragmitis]PRD43512.1 L-ectoine synthase [Phyllobacterium phragmitis]